MNHVLQRGTDFTDKDGLLLQIRELQRPTLRGHTHAAAVLAADPLDDNGVPRSRARAKRAAEQRWGRTRQQHHGATRLTSSHTSTAGPLHLWALLDRIYRVDLVGT